MTPKQKREARILFWKEQLQKLRLWFWCGVGVAITLLLPDLSGGIHGIQLYRPNIIEVVVALGLSLLAVILDEELGGDKLCKTKAAWKRKRKHALIVGFGVLAAIEKLSGGLL